MDRLAAMETFARIVETGSFSAAARQLRVGQPAVSKTIAGLEERVGARLLLRSPRGLVLTEAGQNFFEHAKRAIAEADEAELAARGAGAGLLGRLRISAAVTFARLHLVPHLPSFLAQHPQLNVELILDDRNVDLIEEGIDVALRMGALVDSELAARRIGRSRRLVLGTPGYFAKAGEPATPVDLVAHQCVVYEQKGGGDDWLFRQGMREVPVNLSGRVRTTAAEAVREGVFAGIGLTVASDWMFAPELKDGRVRTVLDDWTLPPIDLWAVFATDRRASVKARTFAAFAEMQMRKDYPAE